MRVPVVATAVAGVILTAGAACGGNDDDKIQALQTSVSTIQDSVTKTQILAALGSLSAANLHDVDTDLQSASTIDPELLGTIRKARQTTVSAPWPQELKTQADELLAGLQEFQAALEKDDLAASKAASTKAHEAWDKLEQLGYAFLAGETPAPEEATPTATTSPVR